MILLILVFEGYLTRNELRFSRLESHDWKTTAESVKAAGRSGGVFCFGDSQIKYGLLPLVMESRLGQPVECFAIQGGQAPSSFFLLRKAIEAGARPSAIVVDWEPHLLRDGVDHNFRMWPELVDLRDNLELAWTSGDLGSFLSRTVATLLPSVRERFEVRDNIKAALNGEKPNLVERIEMSWRNKVMNRGANALAKDHFGRNADLTRWGNMGKTRWAADPVNTTYARRFLRLARDHDIPVVVALMPVSPAMQRKYEDNGIDRPHAEWVEDLVRRFANASVVDLRHSSYAPDVFYDPVHLDRDGAVSASLAVASLLRDRLEGRGAVDRWVRMPPYRTEVAEVAFEDTTRTFQVLSRSGRIRR